MDSTVLALGTSLFLFATAVIGYFSAIRKIDQIHVLVNSRLTKALEYIEVLTESIVEEGGVVPPNDA